MTLVGKCIYCIYWSTNCEDRLKHRDLPLMDGYGFERPPMAYERDREERRHSRSPSPSRRRRRWVQHTPSFSPSVHLCTPSPSMPTLRCWVCRVQEPLAAASLTPLSLHESEALSLLLRVLRDSSVRGQLTATTAMCIARGDDLSRVQPVQSPRARRASIVAAVLPPIHRRQVLTSSAKWRCFREPDAAFKLVAAEALAFDRTGIFPVWDTLAVPSACVLR
jgi:hypothetical protein